MVRYRFSEDVVARLEAIKWWDFSNEALRVLAPYCANVEEFLRVADNYEK